MPHPLLMLPPTLSREVFVDLAQRWHEDTRFLSSSTDILAHPAYRQIVAAGPTMVPFILDDLSHDRGMWFDALDRLTGGAVVMPRALAGRIRQMREIWLAWGEAQGLWSPPAP